MKLLTLCTLILFSLNSWSQNIDSTRALSEINVIDKADAYPFITEDGLRLYYTHKPETYNNLYFATRPDIYSAFGPKQLVDSALFVNIINVCLSADELSAYYSKAEILYHATRPDVNSAFGTPDVVTLIGGTMDYKLGVSLTPNNDELYVLESSSGLRKYTYTSPNTYTLNDSIGVPVGYEVGVGRLSHDGLDMFVSMNEVLSDTNHVYKMSRSAIGDDFGTPVIMNNMINSAGLSNGQMTHGSAANVYVWVRSTQNLWSSNDLYMAYAHNIGILELEAEEVTIELYPNPTASMTLVEFELQKQAKVQFTVVDEMGKVVRQFSRTYDSGENQEQFDLSEFSEGVYFLTIGADELTTTKKVIKTN